LPPQRAQVDAELLAFFIEVAALQAEGFGGVGHTGVALELGEDHVALEGFGAGGECAGCSLGGRGSGGGRESQGPSFDNQQKLLAQPGGELGIIAIERGSSVQNVAIQRAGQLPPSVRAAVEQLLGRPVDLDEEISIVATPAQHVPSAPDREAVAAQLEKFLNRRARKVADVPDEAIDAAVDEAIEHVRHNRG